MFTLKINTGGSAFRDENKEDKHGDFELDESGYEVRRILKELSKKLEAGYEDGVVMDINGNKVGEWTYR